MVLLEQPISNRERTIETNTSNCQLRQIWTNITKNSFTQTTY